MNTLSGIKIIYELIHDLFTHIAYEWQSAIRHPGTHSTQNLCAPGASTLVQNALTSLAAAALPQTPLGELTYLRRMKSMTTGWKSNLKNASSMNEHTLLEIIAPDASISVQNATKSLAAGAPPQTPLGELTYIYH